MPATVCKESSRSVNSAVRSSGSAESSFCSMARWRGQRQESELERVERQRRPVAGWGQHWGFGLRAGRGTWAFHVFWCLLDELKFRFGTAYPPPPVLLQKSVHATENRGVEFRSGARKREKRAVREAEFARLRVWSGGLGASVIREDSTK